MTQKNSWRAACASALLFSLLLSSPAAAQPESAGAKFLALGLVSETDRQEIEQHFKEFADYVSRKVSSTPPPEPKVILAATAAELAKLLTAGKVDYYMESAYPTYVINDVHGAGKLLLRRWKSGLADYYSVVFVRAGGPIKRLEDLHGQTIVFEDAGSTSGYLLPKLFLQRHGLKLVEQREAQNPTPGAVGYRFAQGREKLVEAVLTGRAAAGAFSNDDLAALDPQKKSQIAVLAQTEWLPRHLLSVRRDLPPALSARLQAVLLAMHDDPEGKKILQKADGTTKFDLLPGGEAAMRRRLLDSFYSPK